MLVHMHPHFSYRGSLAVANKLSVPRIVEPRLEMHSIVLSVLESKIEYVYYVMNVNTKECRYYFNLYSD